MKVTILPPRRPNLEADEISAIEALLMLASGVGRDSSPPPSSDSTALTTRVIASNPNKKIHHECSICHKGFSTGQALGGHMTSHRKIKIKKSSHGGPCNAAAPPIPILTNKNIPKCGQKRKHDNKDDE
ncbi:PREDICTED: zinc finger protein AZF2-like, partial [Erythranthe guttata]